MKRAIGIGNMRPSFQNPTDSLTHSLDVVSE